jgi:hypothetical protein
MEQMCVFAINQSGTCVCTYKVSEVLTHSLRGAKNDQYLEQFEASSGAVFRISVDFIYSMSFMINR